MPRHQPTPEERQAINLLEAAGYTVVRRATYQNLKQKIADANWQVYMSMAETELARVTAEERWKDFRHICDRLNHVIAAAAAHGVSLLEINTALDKATPTR